jgi:hypothetical protein
MTRAGCRRYWWATGSITQLVLPVWLSRQAHRESTSSHLLALVVMSLYRTGLRESSGSESSFKSDQPQALTTGRQSQTGGHPVAAGCHHA